MVDRMNINDYLPVYYFDDSFYYKVRDIATYIGLSKGVSDRLISNVKKDIIL